MLNYQEGAAEGDKAMSVGENQSYQRLADLLVGAKVAFMLRSMAELGIPDELASEAKSAELLAEDLGLAADPLRRVMRALTQFGVFDELPDGRFQNTGMSACMRRDANPSLRDAILFLNHDVSLGAWLRLSETLRDGVSRFQEVNGGPLFSLFAKDRDLADHFAHCMRNLYGAEAAKIANGYSYESYGSIVDVGGGQGHILAAILSANPDMTGTLLDIEATAPLAREFLRARGLSDRINVIGGDFFAEVPGRHDAYLVKSVLHDWNDERATSILIKCREAMSEDARLLIIEEVIQPGKRVGNPNRLVDLDLMIHLGGRERTEPEYRQLMTNAGFVPGEIKPIPGSFFSVIEGSAAPHP